MSIVYPPSYGGNAVQTTATATATIHPVTVQTDRLIVRIFIHIHYRSDILQIDPNSVHKMLQREKRIFLDISGKWKI